MALGWRNIYELVTVKVRKKVQLEDYWNIMFPLPGKASNPLCRIFPGIIKSEMCHEDHKCGILDLLYAKKYANQRTELDLITEEECGCFYDGQFAHEARIHFYLL